MENQSTENLSRFALTNQLEWIDRFIEQLGCKGMDDYHKKVFSALEKLRPGRHYDIARDVPHDKQELFIKLACMYIRDIDGSIIFDDDYCKIYKQH